MLRVKFFFASSGVARPWEEGGQNNDVITTQLDETALALAKQFCWV